MRRLGDVGALAWVAEQLDVVGRIDRACGLTTSAKTPSLGEVLSDGTRSKSFGENGVVRVGAQGPDVSSGAVISGKRLVVAGWSQSPDTGIGQATLWGFRF